MRPKPRLWRSPSSSLPPSCCNGALSKIGVNRRCADLSDTGRSRSAAAGYFHTDSPRANFAIQAERRYRRLPVFVTGHRYSLPPRHRTSGTGGRHRKGDRRKWDRPPREVGYPYPRRHRFASRDVVDCPTALHHFYAKRPLAMGYPRQQSQNSEPAERGSNTPQAGVHGAFFGSAHQ